MHHAINLKRSVATVAAAAGLLAAAAGPANAGTVTCLDQDLNTLMLSAGSAPLSLKFDSNEIAEWRAQRTSLGRENSIEM
jgi:hypothetical protein